MTKEQKENELFERLRHEMSIRNLYLIRSWEYGKPGRFGKYYIAVPPFVLETHVDLKRLSKQIAEGKIVEPIEGRA